MAATQAEQSPVASTMCIKCKKRLGVSVDCILVQTYADLIRAALFVAGYAMPQYMTSEEVRQLLRISHRQLFYMVKRGQLPCYKVTVRRLFKREDVLALIQPC